MNRGRLLHILTLIDRLNDLGEERSRKSRCYTTAMLTYNRDSVQVNVFSHGGDGNDLVFVAPTREGAFVGKYARRDEELYQCEEYLKGILEVVA